MLIATLDSSNIRFTFDTNFIIKDVLKQEEFVKMTVEGLPQIDIEDNLKLIGVTEDELSRVSSFQNKDKEMNLNAWFLSKKTA